MVKTIKILEFPLLYSSFYVKKNVLNITENIFLNDLVIQNFLIMISDFKFF